MKSATGASAVCESDNRKEKIMAKRIIFGLLLTAFGITMLWLRYTFLVVIVIAAISVVATYELNTAVKLKNKPIMVLSLMASAAVPLYYEYGEYLNRLPLNLDGKYLISLYIIALCVFMLFEYENTKFSQVATVVMSSLCVPFAVTRILYFRDIDKFFPEQNYNENHGLFLILFAMFCAWITDSGAYFAGSFFGKHKLCPNISPKKTVEGAIGGVLVCIVATEVLYAVFANVIFEEQSNSYLSIALMTLFLSALSMCGDLTASVIKRNFGIKDFGNLIPGHGGIMDRFDSFIFVIVALYAIFNIFGVVI